MRTKRLITALICRSDMGQIRECTDCARQLYSLAVENWSCTVDGCKGVMRLVIDKDRPRNRMTGDGRRLGEFW